MTVLKTVSFLVIAAAAGALVALQIAYLPTRNGAQILGAPAAVVVATYAALIADSSPVIRRLITRLRRQERADIARFFAVLSLWVLPVGLLIYCTWTHFNG